MSAALEGAARTALDRLCPPGPVGVALSGGGDSTALLLLTATYAPGRVEAATVDHRLRADSAGEAAAAGRLAARHGLAHEVLVWREGPGRGNLQAAAREARGALLAGWAARRGLSAVLLGHTLDDQAETVLMRLARGAGADGLSAMAEARRARATLWLRPLLGLARADLRAWLAARGESWVEDPSNADPRFERVRARRALAALAPLGITAEGLGATAARLAEQRRVLEAAKDALAARARRWEGEAAHLACAPLAEAERDTALRLLAETLTTLAPAPYPPRRAALERALAAILDGAPGHTLAGCLIRPRGGEARITREGAGRLWSCGPSDATLDDDGA